MLAWPLCRCVNTMFLHGPMIDAANYAINNLMKQRGIAWDKQRRIARDKQRRIAWDNIYNKCFKYISQNMSCTGFCRIGETWFFTRKPTVPLKASVINALINHQSQEQRHHMEFTMRRSVDKWREIRVGLRVEMEKDQNFPVLPQPASATYLPLRVKVNVCKFYSANRHKFRLFIKDFFGRSIWTRHRHVATIQLTVSAEIARKCTSSVEQAFEQKFLQNWRH